MTERDPVPADLKAQLDRERRKLELVRDIGLALGSTLDLDELLARIAENVTELIEAERSTIYVVDHDRSELWSRVVQGEKQVEIRLPIGAGIAGWVAEHGQVLNVQDAYIDERFDPAWDRLTGYRTRSILCAPMGDRDGRVIGVLQVLNKREGRLFTSDDEVFILAVAGQAAVSLRNAQLVRSLLGNNQELEHTRDELEQRNRELDLLLEMEQLASSSRDLDDLLARVIERSTERCGADAGAVILADPGSDGLKPEAAFAAPGRGLSRFPLESGQGIVGWVVKHGKTVRHATGAPIVEPCSAGTVGDHVGFPASSVLCVPLQGHRGMLGAIELLRREGRDAFTEADQKVLTLISGQVARALELARDRERRDREERLATIGHLLSGVLHDLKTPMTVISGYVQLMVQADDAALRKTYAETVLKQLQHIGAMTAEILAFARGESKILLRRVYLYQFMEEVGELLRKELEPRGIEVIFDIQYRGTARFDENKMRRVFHNIARNAAEAMPGGGTFSVTIGRDGQRLVITFSDTGVGVPAEIEDRLFESFATAGKKGGTGLGLAVVKKIIDEHQGTISFKSAPEHGTAFTIQIPLAE
jgi:signal transduction histidine kinase/putative methionine-R-sulfoxide reductase with GAF domain